MSTYSRYSALLRVQANPNNDLKVEFDNFGIPKLVGKGGFGEVRIRSTPKCLDNSSNLNWFSADNQVCDRSLNNEKSCICRLWHIESNANGCLVFFMLALVPMQVYKGRWNGVPVAVKALISEDPGEAEAFQREIAVLEVLRHPHVVNYLAMLAAEDGTVRIVMSPQNYLRMCF